MRCEPLTVYRTAEPSRVSFSRNANCAAPARRINYHRQLAFAVRFDSPTCLHHSQCELSKRPGMESHVIDQINGDHGSYLGLSFERFDQIMGRLFGHGTFPPIVRAITTWVHQRAISRRCWRFIRRLTHLLPSAPVGAEPPPSEEDYAPAAVEARRLIRSSRPYLRRLPHACWKFDPSLVQEYHSSPTRGNVECSPWPFQCGAVHQSPQGTSYDVATD